MIAENPPPADQPWNVPLNDLSGLLWMAMSEYLKENGYRPAA